MAVLLYEAETVEGLYQSLPDMIRAYACSRWPKSDVCHYWGAAHKQSVCLWDIATWENYLHDPWLYNPRSTDPVIENRAFGLWQIKPGTKLDVWTANHVQGAPSWIDLHPFLNPRGPHAQADWAIEYAFMRYGSPCQARAEKLRKGWW